MFGFFKKKNAQDPYLQKVAAVLYATVGPVMPQPNAFNLAAECLGELHSHIAQGVFRPGPNPRETVMAYYCLCSMVRESRSSDDKQMVFKISIMARVLGSKFGDQLTFTPLEKGICLFGEQTLDEYFPAQSKADLADLKRKASEIVFNITYANGAPLSHNDAATLVDNVCANIPETDACKGGEKVLALSALTSITAYAIDQDDIEGANAYFACVNAAMKKYVEGQMESFSDYQAEGLRTIMREYGSVVEELKEANKIANDDSSWADSLIRWAEAHNLPEPRKTEIVSGIETTSSGFPRSKEELFFISKIERLSRGAYFEERLEINLNYAGLTVLPKEFFNLIGTHVLYLYENKLTELPPDISKLKFLHTLDLGKNCLRQLPEAISELQNLKDLNLYGNDLTSLPLSIVALENLQKVNLEGNPNLELTHDQRKWLAERSE